MSRPRSLAVFAAACLAAVACLVAVAAAATSARAATSAGASDPWRVQVVQTNAGLTQHLSPLPDRRFGRAATGAGPVVRVNAGLGYQRVQGFGGAITDSSAWLIERDLSPTARQALMTELFGVGGIHLDFVKVPIGASDFTHNGVPYSYDDLPAGESDPTLAHFSIGHDRAYILPALQQALALDPATTFLATPWSPPAWMKTNGSLDNNFNQGLLRPADYGAWAAYFVRFIQAYRAAHIPIGSVTVQNEPGVGTLYPGLDFPAADEAAWITQDLAPALARAHLHVKIYGNDLGWGATTTFASAAASGPAARDLAGLAWHCYYGAPSVMSAFHAASPRMDQIIDECSPGISPTPIAEIAISSLRSWASVVSLWNLALDPTGGPAQLPNHGCEGCQGIVTIDPAHGTVSLGATYDQIGQLSKFIAPGAQRIDSSNFVTYRYPGKGLNVVSPGHHDVAVRNPDGSLVLVAYDNSSSPVSFRVAWKGRSFGYRLPAGATVTFEWNRPASAADARR
jgi:glucosylceramidase